MLQIPCPHCGLRSEHEFVCTGEASERPLQPEALDEVAWADRLYQRDNPDTPVLEQWWHVHGCRSWLWVRRDPHSQRILEARVTGPSA
jgi:heterotetrameric sarcosine oxidase delta subunit